MVSSSLARPSAPLVAGVKRRLKKILGKRASQILGCRRRYCVDGLKRDSSNRRYRSEVRSYWIRHFGRSVHPLWHLACAKVTGIEDVRYIPLYEWWVEILPFLNDLSMRPAFRDKNLSDTFLDYARTPQTVIKRMNGRYYEKDNRSITPRGAERCILVDPAELIVKPSQTDNGYGVRNLGTEDGVLLLDGSRCRLADVEAAYGRNFIVQQKIRQHPSLAQVHPSSVNTIRIVTFRWDSKIIVLLAFIRFGSDGRLTDNASTGGLCCGIDAQGKLNDSAVDFSGRIHDRHPTSGYCFKDRMEIPGYEDVRQTATRLHSQLFHFDIVSWDFAIDDVGAAVFLEVNFRGSVDLYQFACRQPLFGDLTEAVLETTRDNRSKRSVVAQGFVEPRDNEERWY